MKINFIQRLTALPSINNIKRFFAAAVIISCLAGCNKVKDTGSSSSINSERVISSSQVLGDLTSDPQSQCPTIDPSSKSTPAKTTSSALPQTESVSPQAVINEVKKSITALNTKTVYTEKIANPQTLQFAVEASGTTTQAVGVIYDGILDALGYDDYLEFIANPYQAQPALFDYQYNIKYIGLIENGSKQGFTVYYKLNPQAFSNEIFNSELACNSAACLLSNSDVKVKRVSEIKDFKEIITLNDVQSFHTTDEAAKKLAETAQNIIYGKNLKGGVGYTKFDFVYYGKTDTYYTFLLYLK